MGVSFKKVFSDLHCRGIDLTGKSGFSQDDA